MPRAKAAQPVRITKKVADTWFPPEGKADGYLWDTDLRGFGLRVRDGARTFVMRWTPKGEKTRQDSVGRVGELTPDEARAKAEGLRDAVKNGNDPRKPSPAGKTVKDMLDRFEAEYLPLKKPRTGANYKYLALKVNAAIGSLEVEHLEVKHIAQVHDSLRDTPRTANHAIAMLSRALNLSESWGWRPLGSNPISAWRRVGGMFQETKRERFLDADELRRLFAAIREAGQPRESRKRNQEKDRDHGRNPAALAALRLLIYTGMRKGEVVALKWADLRLDAARPHIQLTEHKTSGTMGVKLIPLNAPALAVLRGLEASKLSKWVFPATYAEPEKRGRKVTGHMSTALDRTWQAVRKLAKLEDVRIHDLRHTFASIGINAGIDLKRLGGGLLGHADQKTTERYAHLALATSLEDSETIGAIIAKAE
jgi:integrase